MFFVLAIAYDEIMALFMVTFVSLFNQTAIEV